MNHHTPEEQRNLDLVLAMFAAVLEPMDSSAVDRFMAPNYIQHSSMAGTGPEGLKAFLDEQKGLLGKVHHDIKRSFVDGNHVCMHYHVHWADAPGFAVMDIFRIEGDRIAEHWDVIQPMPEKMLHGNSMF